MAPIQLEVRQKPPTGEARPTPLLFVHGAWHAAWCWDVNFLEFFSAAGYDTYAMSWRSHGESEKVGSLRFTSIADYVADVAQAADEIEAKTGKRPLVIAHSLGAFVAQRYLHQYQAPGAVLIAPMPAKGSIGATLRVFRHEPFNFLKTNVVMDLYPLVDTIRRAWWGLFSTEALAKRYQPKLQSESYRAYVETLIPMPPVKALTLPMLVISAALDNIFSVGECRDTAKLHQAEIEVFDCAHDVMLEPKWQPAAERIHRWLGSRGF